MSDACIRCVVTDTVFDSNVDTSDVERDGRCGRDKAGGNPARKIVIPAGAVDRCANEGLAVTCGWLCQNRHAAKSAPKTTTQASAAALGLFAAGIALSGPHSLNNIVSITFAVALLSFVAEFIWRKYLES